MYSIIDIESNGGAFREECIIEIAIYQFDGHQITDQFSSIINPEAKISFFVQKLTGITPKMVKTAPKFHEVAKRVIEITQNTTLVGHNVEFDYRMLKQSFKRLGYDFEIETIDTLPLAKKLIPDEASYSLGKLSKSLGFPIAEHHRAAGDARATLDLFKLLLTKDRAHEIIEAHHQERQAKTYLNHTKVITEHLPARKGIIYFQNADGKVLFFRYVEDIYRFAKTVFNAHSPRWHKLQKATTQVSFELAPSDLLAHLMASTQGLSIKSAFNYGLYFQDEIWTVAKSTRNALVKFRTLSQAKKALEYINQKQFNEGELKALISVKNQNLLLTGQGRTRGEKSFILLENGKITGYGFYDWFSQISTYDKISKLKISVEHTTPAVYNELKLAFLRNEFKKQEIPA
ncbi:3'-5' exonuclease [Riemerella columbina]|uniref:3'-5' exonuclease n=1 Tax=Riemerella columbina TaxID=103810 RepID=UPI002670A9D9|nr:3'-5' exonuclease [Riemerella columbina]WKS95188.1 3'-5' exonuclease [Riemerella columbina]